MKFISALSRLFLTSNQAEVEVSSLQKFRDQARNIKKTDSSLEGIEKAFSDALSHFPVTQKTLEDVADCYLAVYTNSKECGLKKISPILSARIKENKQFAKSFFDELANLSHKMDDTQSRREFSRYSLTLLGSS